jgi:hypothetical protein
MKGSVRQSRRRLRMLGVLTGKRCRGVTLGFQRRQAGARELLRLKVGFGARNGCLSRRIIRRCGAGRARRPGGGNRLARIAHFLDRSARTSGQTGNTDKYSEKAQHRMVGH